MEWIQSQWNLEREIGKITANGVAEAEINIPADREGALRFLCCHVRVEDFSAETAMGQIQAEGTVCFTVLYETASGVESMQSRNGFSHTLTMSKAQVGQRVQIKVSALSNQVRWINERQCSVEAVLEMQAVLYERDEKEFISDVQGEHVEQIAESLEGAWAAGTSRNTLVLKEDIELDETLPEAENVLLCLGYTDIEKISSQAGQMNVDGSLQLQVLYGTSDTKHIAKTQILLRFSGQWDAAELGQARWLVGEGRLQECRVRVYENIRGQRRVLAVEARVLMTVQGYMRQESMAVMDAYSQTQQMLPSRETWVIPSLPMQMQNTVTVSGTLKLPEGAELPEKIIQVIANPVTDSILVENDHVAVNGRLMTQLIHENSEGILGCITAAADFTEDIAVQGITPRDWVQMDMISTAAAAQITADAIVIRDTLEVSVFWRNIAEKNMVTGGESKPWPNELPKGLSLVVAQAEEDVWQMAKRCRIPVSSLVAANPQLKKRQLEKGECLVVERM